MSAFTAEAASGLLDMIGDPEREPLRFGGHQLAYAAGLAAYTGLSALLCEPRPRPPRRVDVDLVDVGIWLNWKSVVTAQVQGRSLTRLGRRGEWHVLACADGWVAFVYRDFDALRAAVADERLADPRFATREGRRRHSDALGAIVEETFRQLTRREISELARRHRIPLGPIWASGEIVADPQSRARELFHAVPDGAGGTAAIPRAPVLWNAVVPRPGAAPDLPPAEPP